MVLAVPSNKMIFARVILTDMGCHQAVPGLLIDSVRDIAINNTSTIYSNTVGMAAVCGGEARNWLTCQGTGEKKVLTMR